MRTSTLLALLMVTLAGVTPLRSADADPGGVIVQEQQGNYRVTARFTVPQPPSAVLAVLTDYEQIPRFMPDVKTSIVRSRGHRRALVEQEAQARVLMFSRRVHLLLDIRESDEALLFVDTSGRSFTAYQGAWQVLAVDGATRVSYQLEARPAFDVPQFLLVRVLRKDSTEMIEQLRAEIAARAAATQGE